MGLYATRAEGVIVDRHLIDWAREEAFETGGVLPTSARADRPIGVGDLNGTGGVGQAGMVVRFRIVVLNLAATWMSGVDNG